MSNFEQCFKSPNLTCNNPRQPLQALPKQDWLVVFRHPSEKYECLSWDGDIPYMKWKNKMHVPNHQPEEKGSKIWVTNNWQRSLDAHPGCLVHDPCVTNHGLYLLVDLPYICRGKFRTPKLKVLYLYHKRQCFEDMSSYIAPIQVGTSNKSVPEMAIDINNL